LATALYVIAIVLLGFVVGLPVDLHVYFRERRYGFMNQGLAAWFGDQVKVLLIATALQALFFPILYVAIRRMRRAWWIAGSALAIVFVVVGMVVAPVFLAPLFNTFTPLKDESLRADILALAHAQGIPAGEVYEVDASRQSEHTNAYVAGILGTQRIVLYDTLLRRFAPREIRAVMGHEMGHYVLHHVWKTLALIAVAIVAGLFSVDRLGRRILKARPGWGIAGLEEPASLPLILLLVTGLSLLARPAINTYSRGQEAAADEFGLNVTRDPEAAASVFRKFARQDLEEMHVHPVIETLLYTHPSIAHRVEHARAWAAVHPPAPLETGGGPAESAVPR
ncbi:MAG TPA: M48 family metallopeptidase, partial [Candidatus Polarisedimenticolia bacterium]|nr:M48 family metallopeptidase [Candidatus Polarisedimenticolia bacterium]